MDILLLLLGFICVVAGVFGSFLPVLPGQASVGLELYCYILPAVFLPIIGFSGFSLVITIVLTVLDYVIPAKGTKKFGGSKYGIWGTNIGLIVGIFAPIPLGFIIGPFVGAFVGELIHDSQDHQRALKAATGSLLGFLASSFMKFVVCMMYLGLFLWIVWQNGAALFS